MSRNKRARDAMDRARAAAAQLRPVAEQIKPVAKSTRAAAGRQLRRTRAWTAPRLERTGQVLQDQVAPKVAGLLSTAAERIEPDKRSGRRWRVAVAAALTAAASAAAAIIGRRKRAGEGAAGQADDSARPGDAAPSPNGQPAEAAGKSSQQARQA